MVGFLLLLPAAISANSLSCGYNLVSLSNAGCLAMNSISFNDSMLWTAAGSAWEGMGSPNPQPANGSAQNPADNTSFTGTSVGGITTTATSNQGDLLGRYDEAPWVWAGAGIGWTRAGQLNCTAMNFNTGACISGTSTPYLLWYQGPFYFDNSTTTVYGNGSVDANTALLGTTNGTDPIQLAFSSSISAFGVDISALNAADFTALIQAYNGTTLLGSYYVDAKGYGGTCASLNMMPSAGGAGCNNAPLIAIGNLGPITKIVLGVTDDSTGDPTGFAINTLQFQNPSGGGVPEPASFLLFGCGIALLVWRRKK